MVNMSELKVYRDPKDGLAYREFYEKSEADKVIAEKDEEIDELKERNDELQKATDSAWSRVNAMYDELLHQKYKRCLAMVEMLEHICPITIRKAKWKGKWHMRWLELAEKFKLNSTAQ